MATFLAGTFTKRHRAFAHGPGGSRQMRAEQDIFFLRGQVADMRQMASATAEGVVILCENIDPIGDKMQRATLEKLFEVRERRTMIPWRSTVLSVYGGPRVFTTPCERSALRPQRTLQVRVASEFGHASSDR